MGEKLRHRDCVFHIILNDNELNLFKNSRYIYEKFMTQEQVTIIYIGINYHNLDLNEYGDKETPHYHIALHVNKQMWFSTMINFICDLFGCNANQVTVSKTDLVMRVRYLIHYDEYGQGKHRYDRADIVTNDEDFTNDCFAYIPKITSIKELISIVRAYPNLCDLMVAIGYDNYKKYRTVIRDIRDTPFGPTNALDNAHKQEVPF